jgi:hypothetical protein
MMSNDTRWIISVLVSAAVFFGVGILYANYAAWINQWLIGILFLAASYLIIAEGAHQIYTRIKGSDSSTSTVPVKNDQV